MFKIERKKITLICSKIDANGEHQPHHVEMQARVCAGLAMHKGINASGYTLTHLASSVAIASGIRMPVTVQEEMLQDFASVMDWSLSYDEVTSIWLHNAEVKEAVQSRLKKLHGWS